MPNTTSKDILVRVDDSGGTLTDLSPWINQSGIERATDILDDTGMGMHTHTVFPGLAQAPRIPLNGFVNSTTDSVFGDWVQGTMGPTVSRTVAIRTNRSPVTIYVGEGFAENTTYSTQAGGLQTFATTIVISGALTKTSVMPS